MTKCCCAVGCSNRYKKGSGVSFCRLPSASKFPKLRSFWIYAINRKDWEPGDESWICSEHFAGGKRSWDELSPVYVPKIVARIPSPVKRKAEHNLEAFGQRERRMVAKEAVAQREANDRDNISLEEAVSEDFSDLPSAYEG